MADLTPKLYIKIVIQLFPKVLPKILDLIENYEGELPKDMLEALQILAEPIEKLFEEEGQGILPEGVTYMDLNTYIAEHTIEVNMYLEANPKLAEKYSEISWAFIEKIGEKLGIPPPPPLEELEELGLDEDE